MSDRDYAKIQAQQKALIGSSPKSSLLQRTCACDQHTLAGGECEECRKKREGTLFRSQRGFGLPSTSTSIQENVSSINLSSSGVSHFSHDFSQIPIYPMQRGVLQTKLKINQPGDVYEHEADQVAEQVMRTTDQEILVSDGEDEAKNSLMRKQSAELGANEATASPDVPRIVHAVVNSGGGQPLDTTTRTFMEPRFGHDFSKVRIHTYRQASESAQSLNALAYTIGRNVVFAPGRYQSTTNAGRQLLAHELTHVLQQTGQSPMSISSSLPMLPATETPHNIQAKDDPKGDPIADILPPGTNLQESKTLLLDLFGKEALDRVVAEIRGNEAAKKLVRKMGVAAVLALIDTRRPQGLDPVGAEKKLTTDKQYYERSLLAKQPEHPQEKSLLFQKPPPTPNKPSVKEEGEEAPIESAVSESLTPFVESTTFNIAGVTVRFAHLKAEQRGDKPVPEMQRAEKLVTEAIQGLIQDLESIPDAPSKQARREDEKTRTHLKQAIHAFGASRPLIIFLASEHTLTPRELMGQTSLAFKTDQVYVSRDDLGDPSKLQAAIRIQLIKLLGGTVGLDKAVSALTPEQLKEGVLHETVHAFLITRNLSANQVWDGIKNQIVIQGPPTVKQRCEELIHRYLLAQEEAFVYENVGKMGKDYQAFLSNKDMYDLYVKVVKIFFDSKHAQFGAKKEMLDAKGKGAKMSGDWPITFTYPKTLTVDAGDMTNLNELVAKFPSA